MTNGTAFCALLLLALCCVSTASAGGMVKFHIPEIESAKVGDTVTATLYNDNNLAPPTGDLSLYLDWNMEVLKYESSTFKQGRTTNADLVGLHNLNILAADTTNGFPQGDLPLIEMKFKVVGPGYTPIVIKVDKIHDITGADIASKAVVKNGAVTATGTAPKTTGTTPTVTTGATTVPTTGAVQTFTPLPTTVPASGVTTASGLATVTAVPVAKGPATVPSGTGVFSVTSVGNVPVGGIGKVQLVVDNAWNPNFGDTYIDVGYDPAAVRFLSSDIHVANTTANEQSDGTVRILLGDFRNGYPEGRYALADLYFTSLREGTTPLKVSVDHVRYWNSDFTQFTDISSSASTQDGSFSTGPVTAGTATLAPVTGNPSVTYETLAPVGDVQTAVPSSGGSDGSVNHDTDEYTGVVTKTATPTKTPTPTATEAPVTVVTTVPTATTPLPTTIATLTTTVPTTMKAAQAATPTTTAAPPFGALALAALAGVALVMARARR